MPRCRPPTAYRAGEFHLPPSPSGPTVAADAASFRTVSICQPFAAGRMHRGGVCGSVAECRRDAAGAAGPQDSPCGEGAAALPPMPPPMEAGRMGGSTGRGVPFVAAGVVLPVKVGALPPPRYAPFRTVMRPPPFLPPASRRQPTGSGWGWAGRRGRPLPPCLVAAGAGRRRRGCRRRWCRSESRRRRGMTGGADAVEVAAPPSLHPLHPLPSGKSPPVPSGTGGELDGGGRGGKGWKKGVEKGGGGGGVPYIL